MRRVVAALALGSILACSGLGLCWKQFAVRAHDCCETETAAPAKACGSVGAQVVAVALVSPAEVVVPSAVEEPRAQRDPRGESFVVPHPVRLPPLVLRI